VTGLDVSHGFKGHDRLIKKVVRRPSGIFGCIAHTICLENSIIKYLFIVAGYGELNDNLQTLSVSPAKPNSLNLLLPHSDGRPATGGLQFRASATR
jgi:hypothetical protein